MTRRPPSISLLCPKSSKRLLKYEQSPPMVVSEVFCLTLLRIKLFGVVCFGIDDAVVGHCV